MILNAHVGGLRDIIFLSLEKLLFSLKPLYGELNAAVVQLDFLARYH